MGQIIKLLNRVDIRTTLLIVMSQFLLVVALLGGSSYYFLNKNGTMLESLGVQNQQQAQVLGVMATASEVRAGLLLSAYQMRESYLSGNDDMFVNAEQRVVSLKQEMQTAEQDYNAFYENRSYENAETERLIDELHNTYTPYVYRAIYPLIQALEERDYHTFYLINESQGNVLAEAFQESLRELTTYGQNNIGNSLRTAQESIGMALTIIIIGLAMGLIFTLLVRYLFTRCVVSPLRELGLHFDRIAGGDLSRFMSFDGDNEISFLYNSAHRMQSGLQAMVLQVRNSSSMIHDSALEIFSGNTELNTRMEQTASSLQQTAATMAEIATTVRLNTDNAIEADGVTKKAANVAQEGGVAVRTVASTMSEIEKSSSQITGFVEVIDGIAFQTNILALNAAVEAARAGEQGRGFAVVASEVRALAQRSAQAAREVKALMDSSAVRVHAGAKQANDAGEVIDNVVLSINAASQLMSDITEASDEQADGIGQVNIAVSQMDTVVQQNSELVVQLAGLAGTLQDHAEQLNAAVAQFQVEGDAGTDGGQVIDARASRHLGYHEEPSLTY